MPDILLSYYLLYYIFSLNTSSEALFTGSQLKDAHGNICYVEHIFHEQLHEEKRTVYNFQVEDYHTYYVGENGIWVHNADCMPSDKYLIKTDEKTGDQSHDSYYMNKQVFGDGNKKWMGIHGII